MKIKGKEVVNKIRNDLAEKMANDFIEDFETAPVNYRMKNQIKNRFIRYYMAVMTESTEIINRGYVCENCEDTGIYYITIDKGSHFGAGINEETKAYFCDECEKGEEKKKQGYNLQSF